jgi:hypothetical protein
MLSWQLNAIKRPETINGRMFSLILRSLYFWQNDAQCPFNREPGGPELESECCDRDKFVPVLLRFVNFGY